MELGFLYFLLFFYHLLNELGILYIEELGIMDNNFLKYLDSQGLSSP